MKYQIILTLSILFFISLVSCNSSSKGHDVPTVDLYGEIDAGSCNHLDQSSWEVEVINLNLTDSTTLSRPHIDKIKGDDVWIDDNVRIYLISASTGNCKSNFSKRGQGPE